MNSENSGSIIMLVLILGFFGICGLMVWLSTKCQHLWERQEEIPCFKAGNGSEDPDTIRQVLRCKHCGEIKTVKLV